MVDMSLVGKQAYTPYSTNIDYMVKHKLFLGKPILAVWNGLVSRNNLREIRVAHSQCIFQIIVCDSEVLCRSLEKGCISIVLDRQIGSSG